MKRLLRTLLWLFLFLVVAVLLLPSLGSGFYMGIWSMAFGWLEFLKRVGPQVTVSWSGTGMVIVCSILIVAGIHHLCAWLYRHRLGTEAAANNSWRWQWSLSLYALLWLLFLAAIGVTGFVHQLSWLVTSNEPWSVPRKYRWQLVHNLKQAALEVLVAGNDNEWDLRATQKAFFESENLGSRGGQILQEEVQVLFMPAGSNKLAAAIVFFRDTEKCEKSGFMVVSQDEQNSLKEHPFSQLRSVLATFDR